VGTLRQASPMARWDCGPAGRPGRVRANSSGPRDLPLERPQQTDTGRSAGAAVTGQN
jgi:hypothetical protein